MTFSELYNLARGAGFDEAKARIAAAIALAESSGNPKANCKTGMPCASGGPEDSRGLWQINIRGNPKYAGYDLYDPKINAQVAFEISKGGSDFSAWTTFKTGAYQKYLSGVANVQSALQRFSYKPVSKDTTRIIIYGVAALLVFVVVLRFTH
jgi:hypothetical protein